MPDDEEVDAPEVFKGEIVVEDDGSYSVPKPYNDQKLTTAERQRQAVQMRLAGASYRAIAQALGYADPSGALRAVRSGMKDLRQESAEDLRDVQLARLDSLLLVQWPDAVKKDSPRHTEAVAITMQIMRDMRNLTGIDGMSLDEQIEVEGIIIGGNRDQYIEGLKKMRKQLEQGQQ